VKSVEQQEYEYVAKSRSFKKSLVLEDVMKAMELRTRSSGSHGTKSSFASANNREEAAIVQTLYS